MTENRITWRGIEIMPDNETREAAAVDQSEAAISSRRGWGASPGADAKDRPCCGHPMLAHSLIDIDTKRRVAAVWCVRCTPEPLPGQDLPMHEHGLAELIDGRLLALNRGPTDATTACQEGICDKCKPENIQSGPCLHACHDEAFQATMGLSIEQLDLLRERRCPKCSHAGAPVPLIYYTVRHRWECDGCRKAWLTGHPPAPAGGRGKPVRVTPQAAAVLAVMSDSAPDRQWHEQEIADVISHKIPNLASPLLMNGHIYAVSLVERSTGPYDSLKIEGCRADQADKVAIEMVGLRLEWTRKARERFGMVGIVSVPKDSMRYRNDESAEVATFKSPAPTTGTNAEEPAIRFDLLGKRGRPDHAMVKRADLMRHIQGKIACADEKWIRKLLRTQDRDLTLEAWRALEQAQRDRVPQVAKVIGDELRAQVKQNGEKIEKLRAEAQKQEAESTRYDLLGVDVSDRPMKETIELTAEQIKAMRESPAAFAKMLAGMKLKPWPAIGDQLLEDLNRVNRDIGAKVFGVDLAKPGSKSGTVIREVSLTKDVAVGGGQVLDIVDTITPDRCGSCGAVIVGLKVPPQRHDACGEIRCDPCIQEVEAGDRVSHEILCPKSDTPGLLRALLRGLRGDQLRSVIREDLRARGDSIAHPIIVQVAEACGLLKRLTPQDPASMQVWAGDPGVAGAYLIRRGLCRHAIPQPTGVKGARPKAWEVMQRHGPEKKMAGEAFRLEVSGWIRELIMRAVTKARGVPLCGFGGKVVPFMVMTDLHPDHPKGEIHFRCLRCCGFVSAASTAAYKLQCRHPTP